MLRLRGLRWKEKHEREISASDLARLDAYQAAGDSLGLVDTIRGLDFQTRRLLLALRLGERMRVARGVAVEAVYVASQGIRGQRRASKLVEEVRRITEPVKSRYADALCSFASGMVHYLCGEFRTADKELSEADALFRQQAGALAWEKNNARLFRVFSLRFMGAFGRLRTEYPQYLRDAARRGDHYLETSLQRTCNLLWLASDQPDEAAADLNRTSWTPPETAFHLQHWYELEARGEIALYTDDVGKVASLRRAFDRLARSLLTRVKIVRVLSRALLARLLLASADAAARPDGVRKQATKLVRGLERERVGYASVFAALGRAALTAAAGGHDRAAQVLQEAIDVARESDMALHAAAAQRRLGELVGGDQGQRCVAEADRWMAEAGIANPERMTRVVAPGFGRR